MIFAMPSVPHSGHHFMRYRVFVGYNDNSPYDWDADITRGESRLNDPSIISGHFHGPEMYLWEQIVQQYPVIVPLRHPARNWLSFQKRRKSHLLWSSQWDNMIRLSKTFVSPLYIHIDQLDVREDEAAIMLDAADLDHEVDWSTDKNETGARYGTEFAEITEDLLEDIPQEYIDFYYETMPKSINVKDIRLKEEGVVFV